MRFSNLDAALAWLESHVDFERVAPNRQSVPTLQPIVDTLAALGDPHRDYPCVHITGTNGKGTTTTLTTALLSATGLRVGTFTSPDLHAVNERIAVAEAPIDDESLCELLSRLSDVETATSITLTRFELLTVAALLHFSDEGVDAAVIEVGLGGTWDSTNVIDGAVSVLTNVDLDHVAVLGPTIAHIARDKVGIFRAEGVAVLGTTDPVVVDIAQGKADELGARLVRVGVDAHLDRNDNAVGGRLLSLRTPFAQYDDVLLSLHGVHQGANALVALVAAEEFLGRALGDEVVRRALSHAAMPGRLEVLATRPLIVVDGAHNPAGVHALADSLDGAFHVDGTRRCVLGMLTGRDVDDMVAPLVRVGFQEFFVAAPNSPRAMDPHEVVAALRARGATAHALRDVPTALAHARERSTEDDLIVGCGSLYLVAELRGQVLHLKDRHH